jgi:mono/diheme cytochrome c family protein
MNRKSLRLLFVLLCFSPALLFAQKKSTATSSSAILQQSINRGKTVYQSICLTCHQADGSGVPSLNPPLQKTKWTLGPASTIIKMILKGSQGTVVIDDDPFSNTMPAQPQLTDQQIADVLTYVRNNFGNKASRVTPAQVKAVRAKLK